MNLIQFGMTENSENYTSGVAYTNDSGRFTVRATSDGTLVATSKGNGNVVSLAVSEGEYIPHLFSSISSDTTANLLILF